MIPNNLIVKNRLEELDFARGLAILLMIVFHLIVDLKDFYSYKLEYLQGFWYMEGKLSAILFIFLCGLSSTLSHRSTRHGIHILIWAILLTITTYAYNPDFYIRFGILHLLGISLLSASILRSLQARWLLLLSAVSIFMGLIVSVRFTASPYLFPLGLQTSTFTSLDYYPLFPWFGIFVAGIVAGKYFYPLKQPLFSIPFPKTITWLGRHSLAIYLIHQPILLAFLYVLHRI
ncbi:MAG: hypothetical protein K0R78_1159 [Pelosinus sp.]|jgi:uncharacterized membrane protein|nr:hypothetical protein [Pelosinus sp.]